MGSSSALLKFNARHRADGCKSIRKLDTLLQTLNRKQTSAIDVVEGEDDGIGFDFSGHRRYR